MKETILVGIIGTGGIAGGKHMPALAKLEGVEMTAFCDIEEAKAQAAAQAVRHAHGEGIQGLPRAAQGPDD